MPVVRRAGRHVNALRHRRFGMVSRVGGVVSDDFRKQLLGYGLTTAEILYRMPDHPALLQTYVWQNYDLFPKFPALQDFLAFWQEKLEGPLFSVRVAHSKLVKPAELRAVDGVFRLH
jgi:uncharacterized protein Usg